MSLAAPPPATPDHLAAVPATPVLDEPGALLSPTVLKASPPRSPLRSPGGLSNASGLYSASSPIISPRKAKLALKTATFKAKPLESPTAIEDVLRRSNFLGDFGSPGSKSTASSFDAGPYSRKRAIRLPSEPKTKRLKRRQLPALGPPPVERRASLGEPLDVQKLNEQAREASTSTLPKDQRALARIQTRKRKEASAVVMSRRKALLPHLEGITYIHDELGKARTSALGK